MDRFLHAYTNVEDPDTFGNVTQAAFAAKLGGNPRSAAVQGCRLLMLPNVQKALRKRLDRGPMGKAAASWDKDMRKLQARRDSDIGQVLYWDDKGIALRPYEQIPDEVRWAIKKISVTYTPMGPKHEVEMHDALPAIKLRAQILKKIGPQTVVNIDARQQQLITVTESKLREMTDEQLEAYAALYRQAQALGVLTEGEPPTDAEVVEPPE